MHRARQRVLPLAVLALLFISAQAALAAIDHAPAQSGFVHNPGGGNVPGVQLGNRPVEHSSTVIADVDGNAGNGREVVVGQSDGKVYALRDDGSKLWEYTVATCTTGAWVSSGDDLIRGMPAVGDLDGDGKPEVVVGYGKAKAVANLGCPADNQGGVVAINGESGSAQWTFKTPLEDMNGGLLTGVIGSPGLSDTDGDGRMEVGFGSLNNNVYLLDADGNQLWRYRAFDSIWSSPAFADVNGDGRKEMIIGTDFGPSNCVPNTPGCRIPNAYGFVYAFDTAPTASVRRDFGTGYLWRTTMDQVVFSSPAVGDLDGDGTLEVVVGSGTFYNNGGGKWVKVLDAATGAVERTLATPGRTPTSPALGNIAGDSKLEIVATVEGGQVMAWDASGNLLWSKKPVDVYGAAAGYSEPSNSPVIADLDGNGSQEVAVTVFKSVVVLRGDTGDTLGGKTLMAWHPSIAAPGVGDMDGDGDLELALGSASDQGSFSGKGMMYVWTDFGSWLGSPAGGNTPDAAQWATTRGTPSGVGAIATSIQAPASLSSFLKTGTSQTFVVSLRADTGEPISWNITQTDPSNIFTVDRTSGTGEKLTVTITAPGAAGNYTGTITVSGSGLPSKAIAIAVTATTANVTQTFMPSVRK